MEAWPGDSTKRSRSGQAGSAGSCFTNPLVPVAELPAVLARIEARLGDVRVPQFPAGEGTVKRLMMVITLVTFIPSVVIGFHMVRVSLFEAAADKYVSQVFNFPHTRVIECNKRYAHHGHPSQIELLLLGEPLDDGTIENARTQMGSFGLDKVELVVRQANTDKTDVASLQQSYLELLEEKNRRIGEMAAQLKRYRVTNVEVDDISREVGAMTTNVRAISLMKGITFDVSGAPLDTTLVCVVTPKVASDSIDRTTLANWLRIRTKVANVKLFVEP